MREKTFRILKLARVGANEVKVKLSQLGRIFPPFEKYANEKIYISV